jgi:HNH endonuclease
MKTLKEKSEIRFGLWQAYKNKCAVCSEPIKYTQLQIDHIIPESIERDAMELKNVLSLFSLNNDFEINSLYNLRPACGFCNREKSYYIAPEEITAKLLRKASTKKRDVERESKRFLEEFNYALKVESMRNAVTTGNIVLEEYVDQVNEYVANYGEEYVRIDNELTNFCSINQFTVKLDGHLPTIDEPKGNCIFTFNSFYIRGTVVSLSHEEILQTLYKGFETPLEAHLRSYIIAKIDEDTYIIQIGSCRFNLNQIEVNTFV